jgi:hypothetical protein
MARQTAAQMADVAQWRFTVTGDDGQTVAEGKLRYRPTAAQKAFVNARDKTCRAPGCRRPAQACDRDHIRDWAASKDTSITNLCCLCRRHHRAKHKGRFRIQRGLHGIDWTTPHGRRYTVIHDDAQPPSDTEHRFAQHLHGHHTPSRLRR